MYPITLFGHTEKDESAGNDTEAEEGMDETGKIYFREHKSSSPERKRHE